jgi:DNA-binding CsgD family transcriptional regulator
MESSFDEHGQTRSVPTTAPRSAAFDLCDLASSLVVADEVSAIEALELAARVGGADAALFVWVVPEADGHCWYRSIAALDHDWGASALRRLHAGPCNWLDHAARSNDPLLVRESFLEQDEADGGSPHRTCGRRAAWLIPAPSPQDSDVLGLLILAGQDEHRLDVTSQLLPLYRALALSLSDWFQRRGRDDLVRSAHLTDRDLDLLRHEARGHGSKRIASVLHAEPKTIDCRFHRLNVRLGVANRRDAVRLCKRYGLL